MGIRISPKGCLSWTGQWDKTSSMKEIVDALEADTRSIITSVYLSNKNIGENELIAIVAGLPQSVRLLNLGWNNIGEKEAVAVIQALNSNPNSAIEVLYLDWNDLGDKGSVALIEAIKNDPNSTIKLLSIKANNIGDDGAEPLMQLLQSNSFLPSVDLGWNHISANKLQEIEEILANNKIIQNNTDSEEIYNALKTRTDITEFTLARKADSFLSDTCEKRLGEGTGQNLTTRAIASEKIDDASLEAIIPEFSAHHSINEIDLSDTLQEKQARIKRAREDDEKHDLPNWYVSSLPPMKYARSQNSDENSDEDSENTTSDEDSTQLYAVLTSQEVGTFYVSDTDTNTLTAYQAGLIDDSFLDSDTDTNTLTADQTELIGDSLDSEAL